MSRAISTIHILEKTFRLLDAFRPPRSEWGVSSLARELRLPKSTVHRILRVLAAHGYLAHDPASGRFRLGLAALDLGHRAQEGLELRRVAAPILQRLAAVSGETVLLMVLNEARDRAVCIERAETGEGLKLVLQIGTHAFLHAGSSSKILLAHMAPDEINRVLAGKLPRLAPGTITDPDVLRRDLAATRRRGYALSEEETDTAVAGVSVPITDRQGQVIAGLTIAGPKTRFTRARIPQLVELARAAAAEISRALGGTSAGPAVVAPAADSRRDGRTGARVRPRGRGRSA